MDLHTRCCVVGGGPAGMMLGLLLARAGIDVVVLEKHADFLRDFRGDTVHPSTLEVMSELGLLDALLRRPHEEVRRLGGLIDDRKVILADFSHLPVRCPFVAFMPQWDLLDFLAGEAAKYPTFHLHMEAEVTELVEEAGRVTGVRGTGRDGPFEVRADLVVAADGRRSIVRERAGLAVEDLGAPIDVLWMRLSRRPGDPEDTLGHLRAGHLLVMLDRGTYWQCAFVIAKGGYEALRRGGLPAFRETLRAVVPFLGDRLDELASWDDVHLLTVRVDRLRRWHRPGLLCIGDAAHAMSPVGGVGINLAIQDAVAAANLLAEPLRAGPPTDAQLAAVQRRREFPTRVTQRVQVLIQDRILSRRALGQAPTDELPVLARLLRDHPALRRVPARLIGLGIRPEHVRTPASESPSGLGA